MASISPYPCSAVFVPLMTSSETFICFVGMFMSLLHFVDMQKNCMRLLHSLEIKCRNFFTVFAFSLLKDVSNVILCVSMSACQSGPEYRLLEQQVGYQL